MKSNVEKTMVATLAALLTEANAGEPTCECGEIILNAKKSIDVVAEALAVTINFLADLTAASSDPGARLHAPRGASDKPAPNLH